MSRNNFILADSKFLLIRLREIIKKYVWLPLVRLPNSTPDRFQNIKIKKNIAIPMRDGVRLYANLYKPSEDGKYPVILIRMPYGKDEFYCYMPTHGKFWAKKGYACVVQDVRGKWSSEGTWEPFINEAQDGWDTLDWIVNQPWCDGNIGMFGESYYGYTQWALAPLNHPNLKCFAPGDTTAEVSTGFIYHDFVMYFQVMGAWAHEMDSQKQNNSYRLNPWHLPLISFGDAAGFSCEYFKEWIKHLPGDPYWDRIDVSKNFHKIKIPGLHWGGWYDEFITNTLDGWKGVKNTSEDQKNRNRQWLLIAPTDHEFTPMFSGRIGRLRLGKEAWSFDRLQRFFDFYLRNEQNGLEQQPRIEIFVIGDNKWRFENEWPLARTVFTNYYFHSRGKANTSNGDGLLTTEIPEDEPACQFVYDPNDPVTVSLHTDQLRLAKYLKDRNSVERRGDILVFTSPILLGDLEITGPIQVTLYAASSARDTDFTAALVDVFPDGYIHLIQEGITRARYRNFTQAQSLISPGEIYEYHLNLGASSYVLKKGHKVRVEVSSSNFNRFDRNLNTGNEIGLDAGVVKAKQIIYHNSSYPSHIVLPIIPR